MNTKDFGVVELSQDEAAQIEGGWVLIAYVVAGVVIAAVVDYFG